jgi:hypothetical protein
MTKQCGFSFRLSGDYSVFLVLDFVVSAMVGIGFGVLSSTPFQRLDLLKSRQKSPVRDYGKRKIRSAFLSTVVF